MKLGHIVYTLLALLLAAVICLGAAAAFALQKSPNEEVRIYLPRGITEQAIADTLQARLGQKYGNAVAKLWRLRGGQPHAAEGSYLVKPRTNALRLAQSLLYGRQTPVRVTFNTGRHLSDLSEQMAQKLDFTAEDFIAACDSVLPPRGFTPATYVAAFLPDTYEFYWNSKPITVVERLAQARDRFWSDERRAQAKALGLTPVQVATLASIVEEETYRGDEQPIVARLYLNRLGRKMPLQADPTVKFAVGDPTLRRITGKHLAIESPYNTYKHTGLPPGPIRIPQKSTLEAVLNAPQNNYIYMCAKEDFSGRHNFTADYATHQANARRYQAELNKRGIK